MPDTTQQFEEVLKSRLFSSISNQIGMIGYVAEDLRKISQGFESQSDTIGHIDEDIEYLSSDGLENPESADGGSESFTGTINTYYDEAFYNDDGIMGLLLGDTEFRNIGYWDDQTTNQNSAAENLQDALLEMIPQKAGRILDAACGMGASTKRLMNYYAPENIWAINISEKQIKSTQKNAPGCNAKVMSAVEMGFEDDFFDAIECIEAAFHFETRKKFLEESMRILKPGGTLVLSDVLMTSKHRLEQHAVFPDPKNHIQTAEEYEELLRDTGFKNVVVKDVSREVWGAHFLFVVNRIHEEFYHGRLNIVQLTEILWTYYYLDAITGVCLFASAQK